MNFVFTIVLLNIFSATKAKQKYTSFGSDTASGDSHSNGDSHFNRDSYSRRGSYHQEQLSMADMTSSGEDLDDENPGDSLQNFHEYRTRNDIPKKPFESRKWQKSCLSKASKLCTKACQRAYKRVCKERKCKRRAKKALKSECRKSCTRNFEFDRDRAAQEE